MVISLRSNAVSRGGGGGESYKLFKQQYKGVAVIRLWLWNCILPLQVILLGLSYDEFSWDYNHTPGSESDPDCFDSFWLEFDSEEGDGTTITQLQIFSKQVKRKLIIYVKPFVLHTRRYPSGFKVLTLHGDYMTGLQKISHGKI